MAHRTLAIAVVILALIAAGECLLCNVCIPALSGDNVAQREANKWRANISRTFENKAETDFQVCGQFDNTKEQAQASCPWNDDSVICLDIKHDNWEALSCGRVPFDSDMQCWTCCGGALICPCQGALCNAADRVQQWLAKSSAPPAGGQGAATFPALLVLALAAAC
ncbi:uncharacterized protein LOC119101697 [Pollicipes pollicipes]|uniref:uncharacterized protein LOC119101697 n=1 Tax=Pollicipes pollicipes TaxID=41117 RepID=UPI001884B202|nr:uncharacterized protein LOC119101697 [Pollicipes pollicipes]